MPRKGSTQPLGEAAVPQEETLEQALAVLERSLETPVVSGETEVRAEGLQRAVAGVRDAFRSRSGGDDRRTLCEIGETDPALLPRVDRLEGDRRALLDRWDRAVAGARELGEAAAASPRDETAFRERFERYVPETLALVLQTRAYEAALRTWLNEALQRDRGFGD